MKIIKNFKPILFNTEMVQANLENRKKQTRRIAPFDKRCTKVFQSENGKWQQNYNNNQDPEKMFPGGWNEWTNYSSPYEIGNILWVRETFQSSECFDFQIKSKFVYKANEWDRDFAAEFKIRWKPSLFMPKEAARIFLKVTNVRCERLQDISKADAIAEGIEQIPDWHNEGKRNYFWKDYERNIDESEVDESVAFFNPIHSFQSLWDSINAKKHPWESNPWVWVYDFERIEKPENFN